MTKEKIAVDKISPSVEDTYAGVHNIEDSDCQKYLGDIISDTGKNDKNICVRIKKGNGIIKNIISILDEVFFGKFHFVVSKILKESIFINSILMNSEAWYNLTDTNIDTLEKLDNILLRKIFETGQSVSTAFLQIELGTFPIRFIIKTRRILFLQYILKGKQ